MLEDQLSSGHDYSDDEILGYRYYADGDLTVYIEELHGSGDDITTHVTADAATLVRELRTLRGEPSGARTTFEDGHETIELRVTDAGDIAVTGEDTRDVPLVLSSDDIDQIDDHVRDAKSALRGAGVI
jgi:hypothetical protein